MPERSRRRASEGHTQDKSLGDEFAPGKRETLLLQKSTRFEHLGLTDWPFSIVPTPRGTSFMADRVDLAKELGLLLQRLARRPQSSIHLMWAWFGAGKTHALQYLAYLATSGYRNVLPVYTEFPKTASGFIDLYRQAALAWNLDDIADAYLELATSSEGEQHLRQLADYPDTARALKGLASDDRTEAAAVREWLRGERVPRSIGNSAEFR